MKHLNFIPTELRPKLEIPGILFPVGLVLILMLYVGGSVVSGVMTTRQSESELARIETENADLLKKLDGLSNEKERLKREESMGGMKTILAKKNYWSGIFREMSVLIPEGVWLTSFTDHQEKDKDKDSGKPAARNVRNPASAATGKVDPDVVLIRGESVSQELIAQFLISLEKSHHFAGVQLISTEKEGDVRPLRYKFQFSVPITTVTNGGS